MAATGADYLKSVATTTDGGYIVAGYTESFTPGTSDGGVIKLDANLNEVWSRHPGGPSHDRFYSVAQALDGGYIMAGETWSYGAGAIDGWVVKLDGNGN